MSTLAIIGIGAALFATFVLADPPVWLGSFDLTAGVFKLTVWTIPCLGLTRWWFARSWADTLAVLGLSGASTVVAGFGLTVLVPIAVIQTLGGTVPWEARFLSLGTIVLAPIAEEVLFRGWLFRVLVQRAGWPQAWALAGSALAFGLGHLESGGVVQALSATTVGALLAWMVWRWNSLWPAIVMHAALNLSWEVGSAGDPMAFGSIRVLMFVTAACVTLWFRPVSSLHPAAAAFRQR